MWERAALGAECHLLFLAQRPAMAVAAASTESEMSRSLWALDMKARLVGGRRQVDAQFQHAVKNWLKAGILQAMTWA